MAGRRACEICTGEKRSGDRRPLSVVDEFEAIMGGTSGEDKQLRARFRLRGTNSEGLPRFEDGLPRIEDELESSAL